MHIVKSYEDQLTRLRNLILQMGGLVEQQLADSLHAIKTRDNDLASEAYATDSEVDDLEEQINDLCLKLLALRQPMASDLRLIIGVLRIARDLERIGDYAANLSKRARTLNTLRTLPSTLNLVRMGDMVMPLLKDTMTAFADNDAQRADAICQADAQIDEAYDKLIQEIVSSMQADTNTIEGATHLLFMAKNMERIGDRATNIAENTHFIAKGCLPPTQHKKTAAAPQSPQP